MIISTLTLTGNAPCRFFSHPYRCTGLEVCWGGRQYGGDERSMAVVQTSQLCSGLSVASANTACWRETDPSVFAGMCVIENRAFHTRTEPRATDVGCLFKECAVFV